MYGFAATSSSCFGGFTIVMIGARLTDTVSTRLMNALSYSVGFSRRAIGFGGLSRSLV